MRKEMNTLPLFLLALVVPGGLGLLEHPKHTHTHTSQCSDEPWEKQMSLIQGLRYILGKSNK